MDMPTCETKRCDEPASTRMFWPGNPPLLVCIECAQRAAGVAQAIGFYLHQEPVGLDVASTPQEDPA